MTTRHDAATLRQMRCQHLGADAQLTAAALNDQLAALPDWQVVRANPADPASPLALARSFRFGNYFQTLAFVNAIAWPIHQQDHHPDLLVGYNRCEIKLHTHSAGGITVNDFIVAALIDAVAAQAAISPAPEGAA